MDFPNGTLGWIMSQLAVAHRACLDAVSSLERIAAALDALGKEPESLSVALASIE